MSERPGQLGSAVWLALAALASTLALQIALVRVSHSGDLTGPFLIGELSHPPVERWPLAVASDADGYGYDGQYFLMLALDPWGSEGVRAGLDLPEYRSRRILLPALARLGGLGRPAWIVVAFYAWIAVFVALGVFAVARWAIGHGRSAWWGLLLVAQLGMMASVRRMLADGMVATLLVLAVWAAWREREGLAGGLLALALLTKETALLAVVGFVAAALVRRRPRAAGAYSLAVLPAAAWWWTVRRAVGDDAGVPLASNFTWPLTGIRDGLRANWSAAQPLSHALWDVACVGTYSAAILLGLLWAARAFKRRRRAPAGELEATFTWLLYSVLGLVVSQAVWFEPMAYARVMLPLMICGLLVGLGEERDERWRRAALAPAVAAAALGLIFAGYMLSTGRG